eukprot:RCo048556
MQSPQRMAVREHHCASPPVQSFCPITPRRPKRALTIAFSGAAFPSSPLSPAEDTPEGGSSDSPIYTLNLSASPKTVEGRDVPDSADTVPVSPVWGTSLRWLFAEAPRNLRFQDTPDERAVSPLSERQEHMGMSPRPAKRIPAPSSGGRRVKPAVGQGFCANLSPDSLTLDPGASRIFSRRAGSGFAHTMSFPPLTVVACE